MNLGQILEETSRRYGGKTAIIFNDRRLSYAELDEASNRVANALIAVGISKGDRVAILLPNIPEFAIIYFGIVKAGAIVVPMDIRYTISELASILNDCQPKVLVAESSTLELLAPALPRFKFIEHIIDLNSKYKGQFISYQEIIATSSSNKVEAGLGPEDIAHISYTSGPTSHPRGGMLSHHNLVSEAIISGDGFEQTDKDVVMLFALPLHSMFGLVAVLLTPVCKGSTVVMVPGTGISINTLMGAIEKEKGTMLLGVPYIFALAVNLAEKEGINNDLSSLRLCVSGGAPLSIDVIKRFKQLYGLTLTDIWGLAEAICHVTCPPLDGTGKLGSVGKALPGWEVKVVAGKGRELPPNQPGEVIVRGPMITGYYNNPKATAKVIKDGWLYTGDIGRLAEDGHLFLTGRKKEIIIVKGQNIYPSDIEGVLQRHPKVAEAAVVGIPDKLRGEVVKAVVRLKEGMAATEHEIRRFCLKYMANYRVPKQILFLRSLPRTVAGKIRKKVLRDYLLTASSLPG